MPHYTLTIWRSLPPLGAGCVFALDPCIEIPRGAGANACHLDGHHSHSPESFAMCMANTQLLSLNPLALAGIKDIWHMAAPSRALDTKLMLLFPWASFSKRSRAAFNYMVTMAPSVAKNGTISDIVSSCHHPLDQRATKSCSGSGKASGRRE